MMSNDKDTVNEVTNDQIATESVSKQNDVIKDDFMVKCGTSDNQTVLVKETYLKQCGTYNTMVETLGEGVRNDTFVFNVQIKKDLFEKIVLWMSQHVGVEVAPPEHNPLTHERKWADLTKEEERFLALPPHELVEMITSANYLDLKSLYQYACQTMASLIKEKTPEEIREVLELEDDLTEKEKEEIRKNNVWCNY